jgi:hypothetical protein
MIRIENDRGALAYVMSHEICAILVRDGELDVITKSAGMIEVGGYESITEICLSDVFEEVNELAASEAREAGDG